MILDRVNKIAYAAISERTSPKVLNDFAFENELSNCFI